MNAALLLAASACVVAGCSSEHKQHAQIGDLTFDIPSSWQRADSSTRGSHTTVWTPPAGENERKESITLIYSERSPAVARAGQSTVQQLLAQAQGSLRGHTSGSAAISTPSGLVGQRIVVDFVPPGMRDTYRRVHAAFMEGDHLVHVIYTARVPDPDLDAFAGVVATLQHAEVKS